MSKLSDKPDHVEFIEKGKREIIGVCHHCGKEQGFEGDDTLERGIKWAKMHVDCEEKNG